jgi:hypothetical protein
LGAAERVLETPDKRDRPRYYSEVRLNHFSILSCRYCRDVVDTERTAAAAYCIGRRDYKLCTFWHEDGKPSIAANRRCPQ